jgi:hypothetical protein
MFNRAVVKMVSSNISKCVAAEVRRCLIQHAVAGLRRHRRVVAHLDQPELGQGGAWSAEAGGDCDPVFPDILRSFRLFE